MRGVLLIALFCAVQAASAQTTVTWDELADVTFTSRFDSTFSIDIQDAYFSDYIRNLDGREVMLSGFMIPIDPLGTRYVVSRYPNASCFFCGGAGPETVAELRLKPGHLRRYATDTFATFRGRLQIHEENLTTFNYVLLDAEKL